jgi:hypothetical protein
VKKVVFQNKIMSLVLGFGIMTMPFTFIEAASEDACSKELLLAYFPNNFVIQTLKKFNVPENEREGIAKDLAAKDKNVVKEVEEKASKLNPNPLKDRSPDQRQAAVKIFRDSLLDIFSQVLKDHGIKDEQQIQDMLADIQQQKAKNFAQCMEKQKANFEKERSSQPSKQAPEQLQSPADDETPQSKPDINVSPQVNSQNGSFSLADDSNDSEGSDDEDDNSSNKKPQPKPKNYFSTIADDSDDHDSDDKDDFDSDEDDDYSSNLKSTQSSKQQVKVESDDSNNSNDSNSNKVER